MKIDAYGYRNDSVLLSDKAKRRPMLGLLIWKLFWNYYPPPRSRTGCSKGCTAEPVPSGLIRNSRPLLNWTFEFRDCLPGGPDFFQSHFLLDFFRRKNYYWMGHHYFRPATFHRCIILINLAKFRSSALLRTLFPEYRILTPHSFHRLICLIPSGLAGFL